MRIYRKANPVISLILAVILVLGLLCSLAANLLVNFAVSRMQVVKLSSFGAGKLHLVVNRVRKKMLRSMHATIDDAIDKAGLPLLGVVPEDDELPLCLHLGIPILLGSRQNAAGAYRNIASRLQGNRVPLLRIR